MIDSTLADQHYAEHVHKSFYPSLKISLHRVRSSLSCCGGLSSGSDSRIVWGDGSIEAEPGSIRSDFGVSMTENAIHASDSVDSARREIANFSAFF